MCVLPFHLVPARTNAAKGKHSVTSYSVVIIIIIILSKLFLVDFV